MPTIVELSALDGSDGFVVNGAAARDYSGQSVANAGDVNGDGIDDLIIGAWRADSNGDTNSGAAYVVFGSTAGFSAGIDVTALSGANGFVLTGIDPFDDAGFSVAGAGDVNGDGFDDIVIGAYGANRVSYYGFDYDAVGETYVVFGSSAGFGGAFDLASLNGSNGVVFKGSGLFSSLGGKIGFSVAGAGDINGDGIDDLVIGAPNAAGPGVSGNGETYVVFGRTGGFGAAFELSGVDGTNGFLIDSAGDYEYSGNSVAGAGDVNGDGIDDLIIGARNAHRYDALTLSGAAYVVFGSTAGFAASLALSSLNGANGFVLNGVGAYDHAGTSVSGAGDINGDGIDDIVIGAPFADPNSSNGGAAYVVFGTTAGFAASLDLSALNGANGFVLRGFGYASAGYSVAGAGDVNGDGIDDLIIGGPTRTGGAYDAGASFVVFGATGGFGASFELSSLNGTNGYIINGAADGDASGISVAGGGDFNGDGADDLIIGANEASPFGTYSGATHVVFGFAPPPIVGTPGADTLVGTGGSELIDGLGGDDSIRGGGGDDTIVGGGGDDTLKGEDGDDNIFGGFDDDRAEGGNGNDLIRTGPGKDTLLGGEGNDTLGASNKGDLLRGGGGDDLMLGSNGNDRLFGEAGADTLLGGNGRDTLDGGTGADRLNGGNQIDWASYASAGTGVAASLTTGSGSAGEALGDVLIDIENLEGSAFNDTLTGSSGANRLDGGAGADALSGAGGADILAGESGADTLTGGAGDDKFWYRTGEGADTITDFTAGAATDDVIRLFGFGAGVNTFAEVIALASQVGADTVIDFGGGNSITLAGVALASLHADDFLFG